MGTQIIRCYPIFDVDALTFISRLTGGYSLAELFAINNLFVGLKADGLYNLFDVFHLLCLDNASDSALNILSTSFTCSSVGTFTSRSGVVGGTATSGFIPGFDAVNMETNSNHIGVYLAQYSSIRNTFLVSSSIMLERRLYLESQAESVNREITNLNPTDSIISGLTATEYVGTYINTRPSNSVIKALAGDVEHSVSRIPDDDLSQYTAPLSSTVEAGNRVTALYAGSAITANQSQLLEDRLKTLFTALGVPYS